MMGKMGIESFLQINGSSLSLPFSMALVCISFQSIGYSADLYDDPLSKECIVHYRTVCFSGSVMLPSLLSCCPMFKGKLKKFTSAVKPISVSVLLSQSCGYYFHIILELCSKFCVDDVGLIMALLRRVYSRRHQHTIHELVLETNQVP